MATLAAAYPDEAEVVVSSMVVPLLFPCERAETDTPAGVPEVGVAVEQIKIAKTSGKTKRGGFLNLKKLLRNQYNPS
jgi:hypothetical protein